MSFMGWLEGRLKFTMDLLWVLLWLLLWMFDPPLGLSG